MSTQPATGSVEVGDEMTPYSRTVTQAQINAYADASGDHNPIHVNEEFARTVGLPGTIAHGLLDMAILAEAVARWAGGYERVASVACRFLRPPGWPVPRASCHSQLGHPPEARRLSPSVRAPILPA